MATTIHNQYLQDKVLHAEPLELVRVLYRAAIDSTAAARRHLRDGDIRERSCSIMRAFEIVDHLSTSLDHAAGGEISRNLAELYGYMEARLLEANSRQTDAPLADVEKLLSTLLEAWCAAALPHPAPGVHTPEYAPVSCTY